MVGTTHSKGRHKKILMHAFSISYLELSIQGFHSLYSRQLPACTGTSTVLISLSTFPHSSSSYIPMYYSTTKLSFFVSFSSSKSLLLEVLHDEARRFQNPGILMPLLLFSFCIIGETPCKQLQLERILSSLCY